MGIPSKLARQNLDKEPRNPPEGPREDEPPAWKGLAITTSHRRLRDLNMFQSICSGLGQETRYGRQIFKSIYTFSSASKMPELAQPSATFISLGARAAPWDRRRGQLGKYCRDTGAGGSVQR